MAKRTTTEPIQPTTLYPLPAFKQAVGYSDSAMRQARLKGLNVRYCGKRAFVLGGDFIDFIAANSKSKANTPKAAEELVEVV